MVTFHHSNSFVFPHTCMFPKAHAIRIYVIEILCTTVKHVKFKYTCQIKTFCFCECQYGLLVFLFLVVNLLVH